MKTLLVVFGTRPEAIKLASFILKAKLDKRFRVLVVSTGQHKEMLKPILSFFNITPDYDLDLMKHGQSLTEISTSVMSGLDKILQENHIDGVVVQGDTSSCFMASLTAFYHRIPVIHIEAGLRSGDMYSPFPEELNRRATALIAKFHFSPTETARQNLISENFSADSVYTTGNTGIDALFEVRRRFSSSDLQQELSSQFSFLNPQKKLILVTVHRRESFGQPMEEIMKGLVSLSKRTDLEILIPLHMNPQVRTCAEKVFKNDARWITKGATAQMNDSKIWLCDPVDYVPFIYLMNRAHCIITDSGGVQEEAPSLGKPILVAREKTERPEAIMAGTSRLIPLEETQFLQAVTTVLDTPEVFEKMAQAKNPFGDGHASERILNILAEKL